MSIKRINYYDRLGVDGKERGRGEGFRDRNCSKDQAALEYERRMLASE